MPLRKALPEILSSKSDALSPRMINLIGELIQDWRRLDERIASVSTEIEAMAKRSCQRLMSAVADRHDCAGDDRTDARNAPGVTDLPIDRIAQVVQPTAAQRAALDELKDASVKAAERLETDCPAYQTLTPTGRVEAMEKRLDATLGAVKTVGPTLVKFYNSLSDEQKARFNSLRSASNRAG
jgi:LTXXQ motif family protein